MATYRSGANSRIVIGKEPAYNTADPTPVGHALRKAQFTFSGIKERIQNPELRSNPNPAREVTGLQTVTAQVQVPVTTTELGKLLTLFMGSYAVTGTSAPYSHVWKLSATQPSSCWVEVGDLELAKYDLFSGLYPSGISFGSITKASQYVMATIDFSASGKFTLNGASPQDASPDTSDNRLHSMADCTAKVDTVATALITEASVNLTRTINLYNVLDGNAYASAADLGKYAADCVIRGWRDSGDTIFGYDDNAEHEFTLLSPRKGDATRYVQVDFPEADFFQSEGQSQVTDAPVIASVRVVPFYEDNSDATSIMVTILDDTADFSAIW